MHVFPQARIREFIHRYRNDVALAFYIQMLLGILPVVQISMNISVYYSSFVEEVIHPEYPKKLLNINFDTQQDAGCKNYSPFMVSPFPYVV